MSPNLSHLKQAIAIVNFIADELCDYVVGSLDLHEIEILDIVSRLDIAMELIGRT
jgi:hypothetical protein